MEENKVTPQYSNEYFAHIEEERKKFKKIYTATNAGRIIVSLLSIAIIVVAFILAQGPLKSNSFTVLIVGGVIGLAVLGAATLIFNKIRKEKISKYMDVYYSEVNNYLFKETFTVTANQSDRVMLEDFDKNELYKDIVSCPSRNVAYLKNDNLDLKSYEISGQAIANGDKKAHPVFVGKIFEQKNNYEGEKIVVYFKAKKQELALPPTALDGVEEVENTDKYVIYSNNKEYKKVLKKAVMAAINKIEVNDILIDGSISITKGMTYVALGLDDAIMAVPYKEPVNEVPYKTLNSCMDKVLGLIESLKD